MIQKSWTIEGLDKCYAIYYTAKQMNKLQLVTTWSNFPNIMLKKKKKTEEGGGEDTAKQFSEGLNHFAFIPSKLLSLPPKG